MAINVGSDGIAAAQGAIAAYRSYWQTVDPAAAQPGQDWTEEIALFATGVEQQGLLDTLRRLVARGYHTVGLRRGREQRWILDRLWQSNTGASGADALTATTADQWDVAEYGTVLVQRSGG